MLAAERRTKDDIRAIRTAAEGIEPLRADPAIIDLVAHRRFHTAIYLASHNDLLISTLDGLWDKADRYRRLGLVDEHTEAERDQKAAEHAALVDCVVAGDSATAKQIMRQHIKTSLGAKVASRLATGPAAVASDG